MMKKTTAWMIAILLILSLFTACTGNDPAPVGPDAQPTAEAAVTPAPEAPEEDDDTIIVVDPSEWETAESPALTEETLALFYKGFAGLLGVNYVPVAYLGKQVVAGTVHTFLTRATVVYPGARETFALVFLYEERSGDVRIIDISRSEILTGMDTDGFEQADDPVLTEELQKGFNEAVSTLVGVDYTPVALCATKVSPELSFIIIAESTPVTAEPETGYSFVWLDMSVQGQY